MVGFGIDFGTTNSVVAAFDGRSLTRFVDHNQLPHPSVVWYSHDFPQPQVGRNAKMNLKSYANTPGNHFVRSIKSHLQHEEPFEIFGKVYAPWQVASEIFRFLREDVKSQDLGYAADFHDAVVTIPVYFTGKQRQAIRKAAEKAGIAIKTFIHEPFAAVIGFLYSETAEFKIKEPETILIFDWGGGTLDITLVKLEPDFIYEVGHWGTHRASSVIRSGDDFDNLLMQDVLAHFCEEHQILATGFRLSPGVESQLLQELEFAKIDLSEDEAVDLLIPNFYNESGIPLDQEIERSAFEDLIDADIQDALGRVNDVLRDAHLSASQVGRVLLIGGTSRIPLLRREMYKQFGVTKVVEVPNADTVIAEGAAIVSHHNWQPQLARPVCIQLSDDSQYTVFGLDTILNPTTAYKEVQFFCTDNRDGEARLIVTEAFGEQHKVKQILNISVSENLREIYKERVAVRFNVDRDVVLKIDAKAPIAGKLAKSELYDLYYGLRFAEL
jgi:molecular chaperone DnaK